MAGSGRSRRRLPATRREWGWHRLGDDWARRIVADAAIRRGDVVLDVGAGTGALTVPLLAAGARVIAIELHPERLQVLREIASSSPGLIVVRADAADLRLPRRPFRVVANPPYSVSSALLARLLAPGSRLLSADLVLQRAAAERWCDGRPAGAMRWGRDYSLAIDRTIPRSAFDPAPAVESVVLKVRRRR